MQRYRFRAIFSINPIIFTNMKKRKDYHVIGVMSGTSLDGIDLAQIRFHISEKEGWSFEIVAAETFSYSLDWKEQLREAIHLSEAGLTDFNHRYTDLLGGVIRKFLDTHAIQGVDAVCSHGHTILHQPAKGVTLQIGNLPQLATNVAHNIVCDFRVQDVALGGQGAPLVPVGDTLLFATYDYCINLGGFANVSKDQGGVRIAYDICPVNIVLNRYAEKLGEPYDDGGALAASGEIHSPLLEQLNALEFYHMSPPKSLGLEWVQENIFPLLASHNISEIDMLCTFTEHIAIQLSRQVHSKALVLVTGGGAYNDFLISRLKMHSDIAVVIPAPQIIEYKEALIFGLLGVLKLRNETNCLASVTGAEQDHSSGKIFMV